MDYWFNNGSKPTDDEAYSAFMELAENSKSENCVYHKDVIDAMFRQVQSNQSIPFNNNTVGNRLEVQAVDFDLGTNHVSYFDEDAGDYHNSTGSDWINWNAGKLYRNDGVDIFCDTSAPVRKKYFIGNIFTGEWLQYSLHVARKGLYTIKLKVASGQDGGKIGLICNNIKPIILNVSNSGGLQIGGN